MIMIYIVALGIGHCKGSIIATTSAEKQDNL